MGSFGRRLACGFRNRGTERFACERLTWLRNPPDGFRGRARSIRVPSGASYTLVSDGVSFVVLREAPAPRQPDGKVVVIGRDTKGRPLVQPAPDRGLE